MLLELAGGHIEGTVAQSLGARRWGAHSSPRPPALSPPACISPSRTHPEARGQGGHRISPQVRAGHGVGLCAQRVQWQQATPIN